jgi:hypothetical protein
MLNRHTVYVRITQLVKCVPECRLINDRRMIIFADDTTVIGPISNIGHVGKDRI